MRLTEIFYSIQGEGKTIGKPAVFVRLQGCNLRCNFCDSKYTWDLKDRIDMIPEKVRDEIIKYNCSHVIFTGGEPLLQEKDIEEVIRLLGRKYTYEIETNGTLKPQHLTIYGIQWNVSPKLSNSGNQVIENLDAYIYFNSCKNSIFKFVVQKEEDMKEILQIVIKYQIPNHKVYLMPEGVEEDKLKEKEKWLVEICKHYQFNYSPRLQIAIWGNKRGI